MDKPRNNIGKVPHQRGFALLITLSVLAILIGLTGVLLSYFDEVRKDAIVSKALIQGNLYYTDIQKIIKGFKGKKILFATLYQMPIPLSSPDGRFNILLVCHPRANGININWLGKENDPKMTEQYKVAHKLFENIVQTYDLEDPGRLEELLLEEMQEDKTFIQKENNRLFQKNGIISLKQFEHILQRYQFETDDQKISQVPWEKYFIFDKHGLCN